MTLQQLVREVRDLSKELLKVDPAQPQTMVNGKPIRSFLSKLADRIDDLASSAYNRIDNEVCCIEDVTYVDIDDVRRVMEETLGDYYE